MWNSGCAASVAVWRGGPGRRPAMIDSASGHERHVPDVGDRRPVRAERALGPAGRPRGVEDGDRVVGIEPRDRGRVERFAADQLVEPRVRAIGAVGPHADELHVRRPAVRDHAFEPLFVEERDHRAGVLQRVVQLGTRPPRIQRHDDRAVERRTPERHDELGQVPHRDRDPVAGPDAERRLQFAGEAERSTAHVAERQPLLVVDEVDERLVRGAHARTRRRWCAAHGRTCGAGHRRARSTRPRTVPPGPMSGWSRGSSRYTAAMSDGLVSDPVMVSPG